MIFSYYYPDIRMLIKRSDIIFGHSLSNDAKAINDECRRYNLKSIDYDFYDIKEIYKYYKGINDDVGLVNMSKDLNIDFSKNVHDAYYDAYSTMIEFKKIIDNLEVSALEIIKMCPNAKDSVSNYSVKSMEEARKRKEKEIEDSLTGNGSNRLPIYGINRRRFIQYLTNYKGNNIGNKLNGKSVCFSLNYEENHYKEMLNLAKLIMDQNGKVVCKASNSNIYVKKDYYIDGEIKKDTRLEYVYKEKETGNHIEIIDFDDFLKILEINEEELNNMSFVSLECLFKDDAIIDNEEDKRYFAKIKKNNKKKGNNIVYSVGDSDNEVLGNLFLNMFSDLENELNK